MNVPAVASSSLVLQLKVCVLKENLKENLKTLRITVSHFSTTPTNDWMLNKQVIQPPLFPSVILKPISDCLRELD